MHSQDWVALCSFLVVLHAFDRHHRSTASTSHVLGLLSERSQLHSYLVIGFPMADVRTFHCVRIVVHLSSKPILAHGWLLEVGAVLAFVTRHLVERISFPLRGHIRLRHVSVAVSPVHLSLLFGTAVLSKAVGLSLSTLPLLIRGVIKCLRASRCKMNILVL